MLFKSDCSLDNKSNELSHTLDLVSELNDKCKYIVVIFTYTLILDIDVPKKCS